MLAADVSPEAIENEPGSEPSEPVAAMHGNVLQESPEPISDQIPEQLAGDVNGDGSLTSLDALTLLNSVNDPLAFPITPAMDLDANDLVDLNDYGLVVAAVEAQNFMVPLNLSASASASDQTMQGDWGGSTLLTSGCDADEVLLSTLNATRAELVNQLSGTTLPALITGLNDQIAAIDSTIAQVQARLDDCDPYGGDGSGDDGGGSTEGTSDDPYGGPGDDDGTNGTTTGTNDDPYGGTNGTTTGSTGGTGGTFGTTGGTDDTGGTFVTTTGSTTGTTTTGTTTGTTGSTTGTGTTTGTSGSTTGTGTTTGTSGSTTGTGTTTGTTGSTTGTNSTGTTGSTGGTDSTTTTTGETNGSTMGSTSGTTSGSTEPTAFSIQGLRTGMFHDALDGDDVPRNVREGLGLRVAGWVSGPWSEGNAPDLLVSADMNFDGDFNDPNERVLFESDAYWARSHNEGTHDLYSGFDAYFGIPDDGESILPSGDPGNDTPEDDIDIRIDFIGDPIETTQTVKNVAPLFTTRPTVTFPQIEGETALKVTSSLWDPGVDDRHSVTVTVNESDPSENTDDPSSIDQETGEYVPSEQKTISVLSPMPDAGEDIYPIVITLHDDDTGATNYTILSSDVARNSDDDNGNGVEDMLESGFDDADVIELDLSSITGSHAARSVPPPADPPPAGDPGAGAPPTGTLPTEAEPLEAEGYFDLQYNATQIKLWDSPQKLFQYLPGDQKDATHPYTGQTKVWVEGIGVGTTQIDLSWKPDYDPDTPPDWNQEREILLGHVDVTVWGIDVDIDSDNNNDFNYPENSEWEEYLENNPFAVGKLLGVDDTHFTPIRLRLPQGLDSHNPATRIRMDFDAVGQSGVIRLWNVPKADPDRVVNAIDINGVLLGNQMLQGIEYSLADLNYDPNSGGITVFMEAFIAYNGHDTKLGVDTNGKPTDSVTAVLILPGLPVVSDTVQHMVVRPDTFYRHLIRTDNKGEQIRNALASGAIYPYSDAPEFALKMMDDEDLAELGVPEEIAALLFDDPDSGFKATLYREYVTGTYLLTFAGTDDAQDILVDIVQGLGGFVEQYENAAKLGRSLALVDSLSGALMTTGHSLGGGLAAMAAVAGNIRSDTFNAAGLHRNSILQRDADGNLLDPEQEIFPGIEDRYNSADGLIEAYHLDWDLLSVFQYTVNITPQLIQDAIGTKIEMDGPVDWDLALSSLGFAAKVASGAGIASIIFDLGSIGYTMGLAHTTLYYQYGVFVDETTGWDIYGYEF